jgi:hypothetical protein
MEGPGTDDNQVKNFLGYPVSPVRIGNKKSGAISSDLLIFLAIIKLQICLRLSSTIGLPGHPQQEKTTRIRRRYNG